MKLRTELMPPVLDESMVARLAAFAQEIDYGDPAQTRSQLAAFNQEAMTEYDFLDFKGIYGGQDHDTWVRSVLAMPYERRVMDVTQKELVEMARRVMECDGEEHEVDFWLNMLEINIPNERISDLIFWPNAYFGVEDHSQELSPEQVIEIALGGRDE